MKKEELEKKLESIPEEALNKAYAVDLANGRIQGYYDSAAIAKLLSIEGALFKIVGDKGYGGVSVKLGEFDFTFIFT